MTKSSLILLLITGAAFGADAQKLDPSGVPAAVRNSFSKQFPDITKVQWEKESGVYEAAFKKGPQTMAASFTPKGDLTETEVDIPVSSLPAAVKDYVKANYKETIKEAARITKQRGEINYEAEVGGMDRIFDESGKYLRSVKD